MANPGPEKLNRRGQAIESKFIGFDIADICVNLYLYTLLI